MEITEKDFMRFIEKFKKDEKAREGYEHLGECWPWTASGLPDGRGLFWAGGKTHIAYRYSYQALVGEIPEGLVLDHQCHNPPCVRPGHLRPLTRDQNLQNIQPRRTQGRPRVRGIHRRKPWVAQGMVEGRQKILGTFDELEEAEHFMSKWRAENRPFSHEASLAALAVA